MGIHGSEGQAEDGGTILPLKLTLGPVLGSGTSGDVSPLLRAIDGGRYVVKQVRPKNAGGTADDEELRKLQHEVRLHRLCSEECSAIVRYGFSYLVDETLTVVMEACDAVLWDALAGGDEVWARLTPGAQPDAAQRPPYSERLAIGAELCHAVKHCHSLRVLHRDINPWNVFLVRRAGGESQLGARLGDFGLSVQLPQGSEELQGMEAAGAADLDESALGSLYSAPELGKTYGFPADVFSLGMTLLALWVAPDCFGDADALITVTQSAKQAAETGEGPPPPPPSWSSRASGGSADASSAAVSSKEVATRASILRSLSGAPGDRPLAAEMCQERRGAADVMLSSDTEEDKRAPAPRRCCSGVAWRIWPTKG